MPGILDSMFGTPQQSRIGTLSSLASMPLKMPPLVPTMPWATPGYGSGMGPDNLSSPSTGAAGPSGSPTAAVGADDDKGPSTWQKVAGIVGDALLVGTNHQPIFGPAAQAYAKMQESPTDLAYKRALTAQALRQPNPPAPHYFEANNGDQGAIDSTGNVNILYHDPTPKVQYLTADNGDGTKTVFPMIGGVPMAGAPPQSPPSPSAPGALPPGFTVRKGGAGSGQPGFR